ncbi:MAG: cation-transporting P-type ATPase [Chromatiaceae bacterium]|nr:MAG: cation-transporting P-type ATPase [Chromatiaceae bacterium]
MTPATTPHTLATDELFRDFDSDDAGLTQTEAERRLAAHGPNRLPAPSKRHPLLRLLSHFANILIIMLVIAGIVTGLLGHWVDTAVILGVVVINALIGFIQEGKAEKALEAVGSLLTPTCTVLRDGTRRALPADELVPGDVVLLQSGDRVPADLRLFRVRDLRIEEAMLTGESVPVEKDTRAVDAKASVGDRSGMAYTGTLITYGQGRGVVVATGSDTELGRISAMLSQVRTLKTPLLRQIETFGYWLTAAIVGIATLTFAFGHLVRGIGWGDSFLAAVGLAVAAIPEGLPAIMTITLAIGVQRMAKRHAIIRRLPAVETLGSVTVICSDKTGTLTRNEMTVARVMVADGAWQVSGVGYAPRGEVLPADADPDSATAEDAAAEQRDGVMALARAGMLCNEAELAERDGQWVLLGDPTEGALVVLAAKLGLAAAAERKGWPRVDLIPFESQHRFMATLHHDHEGDGVIYVKGAPERVLGMCEKVHQPDHDEEIDTGAWQDHAEALAADGHRVLAIAMRPAPSDQTELRFDDVQQGLNLLGLVGIIDPPREEAIRAVAECRSAGIRVKMITGDHAATARAIGLQLGIGDGRHSMTGPEIDEVDDHTLEQRAAEVDVFARASPEHKLRLVEALQRRGEVVAMTGDGVNDAPALKRADVGVAMGAKGTDAAREAAETVLTDDNFASIVHAVEEGRTIHDNLTKAILFILPTNGGQAGVIIAAILAGLVLPITPVQILWVNMVTAVTLALALAFEPAERGVMARPPRDPSAPLLSSFLLWRILLVSALLVVGAIGMFLWELERGMPLESARVATINTLVSGQIFYLLSTRAMVAPGFTLAGLTGNRLVPLVIGIIILLQLLFTYAPPMEALFGTGPIDLLAWGFILAIGLAVFVVVECEKWIIRRYRAHKAGPGRQEASQATAPG